MKHLKHFFSQGKIKKQKIALIFIDVDNFKNVNDAVGYESGDLVLQEIIKRIETNIVTIKKTVYYLGVDLFALLIREYPEGSQYISNLAENILQRIEKPITINGITVMVTASIGMCIVPSYASSAESLMQNTDTALKNAKKQGKNKYEFYANVMKNNIKKESQLASDLHEALQRDDQLFIHYQPQVATLTGKIIGAESLIRWDHKDQGLISPEIFVKIAEKTGQIGNLGDWIINRVCKDLKKLHELGFDSLYSSINLSAEQFTKGDVAGFIAEVIWNNKLESKYVELELTESLVMDNPEKSLLMLRVLKSMGMELALDDFGTGYSSLSHLRKFPINKLKVDQSFTKNLKNEKDNQALAATIITMAKRLGLKVVVEGVETKEDLKILMQEDNDLIIQGYLFSQALPLQEYKDLLSYNKNNPFDIF